VQYSALPLANDLPFPKDATRSRSIRTDRI